ncbi:MAG: NAD-binding protein [Rhizomicrobium sp.]
MFVNVFRSRDWFILGPLGLLAIGLGYWGFLACDPSRPCHVVSQADALFRAVGLLRLTGNYVLGADPWQLVVAQFAAPGLFLLGGAKLLLANLRRDVRVAMAHRARGHIIVCGLGDTGRSVVEGLVEAKRTAVAITLNADDANALACERLGVAVLAGDAAQARMLSLAGIARAEAVVMTTGSDAQNLEIGLRAGEMLEGGRNTVQLFAEMRSDWLRDILVGHRSAVLGSKSTELQLFNLYVNSARVLLNSPAFGRAFLQQWPRPHIVLAGFGSAGNDIARQAIESSFALPGVRLSVTVFDDKADVAQRLFKLRNAGLDGLADFTFNSCTFAIDDAAAWRGIESRLAKLRADMVVVTLSDDEDTLHTALQFRACLDRLGQLATPVFARLRQQHKLGEFMRQVESHPLLPDRLVSFGDMKQLTSPEVLLGPALDHLARATHAAYLETIPADDDSPAAVPWARLPQRYKSSNRVFADHIAVKLAAAGYKMATGDGPPAVLDDATIETLARAEHWRWCVEQWAADWRYGPKRDDVRRLHPLLRDWTDIPEEERKANRDLVRRIPAIAGKAGFTLARELVVPLHAPDVAERMLTEIGLGVTPILVVDPSDTVQIDRAKALVDSHRARLRLIWRGAQAMNDVEDRLTGDRALAGAIEGWIWPPD